MLSRRLKKINLSPFQKVKWEPEKAKTTALVLLGAFVFGVSFLGSGKILFDFNQKERQSMLGSQLEEYGFGNALAAENQENENILHSEEFFFPEERQVSEVMSEAAGSVKILAIKKAKAEAAARKLAAEKALRRSAPILSGSTKKLPNGLRVCTGNSDHPQRGGATHMDEDCCADYNETPNPRCYYSPEKMGILKKK